MFGINSERLTKSIVLLLQNTLNILLQIFVKDIFLQVYVALSGRPKGESVSSVLVLPKRSEGNQGHDAAQRHIPPSEARGNAPHNPPAMERSVIAGPS